MHTPTRDGGLRSQSCMVYSGSSYSILLMDPVSLAASIAGVIGLSVQIIQIGYTFCSVFVEFKEDVRSLTAEIVQLTGLLSAIQPLLNDILGSGNEAALRIEELTACETTLLEVKRLLEKSVPKPGHALGNSGKRLLWAARKAELQFALQKLGSHKATFQLALSVNAR